MNGGQEEEVLTAAGHFEEELLILGIEGEDERVTIDDKSEASVLIPWLAQGVATYTLITVCARAPEVYCW